MVFADHDDDVDQEEVHPWRARTRRSPVVVRPVKTGGVSLTNPMQSVPDGYDPLNGKVGAASMMSVTFYNASPTGVVVTET